MGLEYDEKEINTEQDLVKMKFGQRGYLKGSGYAVTRIIDGWLFGNGHSIVFVKLPEKK